MSVESIYNKSDKKDIMKKMLNTISEKIDSEICRCVDEFKAEFFLNYHITELLQECGYDCLEIITEDFKREFLQKLYAICNKKELIFDIWLSNDTLDEENEENEDDEDDEEDENDEDDDNNDNNEEEDPYVLLEFIEEYHDFTGDDLDIFVYVLEKTKEQFETIAKLYNEFDNAVKTEVEDENFTIPMIYTVLLFISVVLLIFSPALSLILVALITCLSIVTYFILSAVKKKKVKELPVTKEEIAKKLDKYIKNQKRVYFTDINKCEELDNLIHEYSKWENFPYDEYVYIDYRSYL